MIYELQVSQLNSNLDKIKIDIISDTTSEDGYVLLGTKSGRIPIAAFPFNISTFCGVRLVRTGNYFAQITKWDDVTVGIPNIAVELIVIYAIT